MMDIKVGQWARTSQNTIVQLVGLNKYKNELRYFDYTGKYIGMVVCENNIIKIADTPMELIEVKDLVYWAKYYYSFNVTSKSLTNKHLIWVNKCRVIDIRNVTKILTPNSNGGFDLQWEAK